MTVRSPKTERFAGWDKRTIPVVPKLMAILQDAYDAAPEGSERVFGLSRNNLNRTMVAILKRAEVEPFGRCFQVLRQSCETEWSNSLPAHAIAAWLGHSEVVSREHYLQVTSEMFDKATGKSAAECAAVCSRTDSHGVASGDDAKVVSHADEPTKTGVSGSQDTENATAPPGIRTPDPLIKSQLLCQLS